MPSTPLSTTPRASSESFLPRAFDALMACPRVLRGYKGCLRSKNNNFMTSAAFAGVCVSCMGSPRPTGMHLLAQTLWTCLATS